MPLERLSNQRGTYRDVDYRLTVYFSPDNAYSGDERLVVVEPRCYVDMRVKTVRDTTPLNPSVPLSFLPWRESDPDPLSKDQQVQRALRKFKARVDDYREVRDKAVQ